MSLPRPAPRAHIDWLTGELTYWQAEGWLDAQHAEEILRSYRPVQRFSLARLVLTLGSGFVGVGLIWLVAANLEALPPLLRFGVAAAFWVATTLVGEWLAGRREHRGSIPSPVVGAARGLAALAFGAVVFQAAQSLQVPAYEPLLVGVWALGALLLAYAVESLAAQVVGLLLGSGWYVWQVASVADDGLSIVLAMLAASVVAIAIATGHTRWRPAFAAAWREVGAALLLVGLFTASIPEIGEGDFVWTWVLAAGLVTAALAAGAAYVIGTGRQRLEAPAALVLSGLGVLLVLTAGEPDPDALRAADILHAVVAVGVYVVVAALVAVLGVVHDSWRLTALATVGLVLFTTVQSFAVFARIIDGAWLFLLLGVVFLATGWVVDRGRRELARSLEAEGTVPA